MGIQKLAGGDKDLEMIKRAIDRVYAQAKLERKTVEEIATKRWGSMDKFNEMLMKVKKSEEKTDSTNREEPITSHHDRSHDRSRNRSRDRSRDRSHDTSRDRSHDRSYDRSRMVASKSGWKTSERREKERSEHHNRVSNEEQEKERETKAEHLGDHARAKKLKDTLENARKAKEAAKNNPQ